MGLVFYAAVLLPLLLTFVLFCIRVLLLTCCLLADKCKYTFIAAANVVVVVLPIRQLHASGWSTCVGGCAAAVDAAVCVEFR